MTFLISVPPYRRGKEDLGFTTLQFAILHQQMKDKERNEEW